MIKKKSYTDQEVKDISKEFFEKTDRYFVLCNYIDNDFDKFKFDLIEYIKTENRQRFLEVKQVFINLDIDLELLLDSINKEFNFMAEHYIFERNTTFVSSLNKDLIIKIVNFRLLCIETIDKLLENTKIPEQNSFLYKILKLVRFK